MSRHHPNGPSRLNLRQHCPGSYNAECAVTDVEDDSEVVYEGNDKAAEGRLRHDVAATGLMYPAQRGDLLERIDGDDSRLLVQSYWRYVAEQYQGLRQAYPGIDITVLIEREVQTVDGRFGTLDLALIIPRIAIVLIDLKNGLPGPARWGLQLADYSGGLRRDYETDNITVAYFAQSGPSVWSYMPGELDERLRQIARILDASSKPDAPCYPGSWCQWCKGKHTCHARNALVAEVRALADPIETIKALELGPRKELYEKIPQAIKRLEDIKKQIDALILAGNLHVPGYCAGTGNGKRVWKDEQQALVELTAIAVEVGAPVDELTELISPAAAEKKLHSAKRIAHLIKKIDGKPAVVRSHE